MSDLEIKHESEIRKIILDELYYSLFGLPISMLINIRENPYVLGILIINDPDLSSPFKLFEIPLELIKAKIHLNLLKNLGINTEETLFVDKSNKWVGCGILSENVNSDPVQITLIFPHQCETYPPFEMILIDSDYLISSCKYYPYLFNPYQITTLEERRNTLYGNNRNRDKFKKYHKDSIVELCIKYINQRESIKDWDFDRIIYEISFSEREYLESNLNNNDLLIKKLFKQSNLINLNGYKFFL